MKKLFLSLIIVLSAFACAKADDVRTLTDATRVELINKATRPYVIDFTATWCGPCRMFAPIYHELASELKDKVDFYTVDVDKNKSLCTAYRVQAVPTIVIYNPANKKSKTITGVVDKATLLAEINAVVK